MSSNVCLDPRPFYNFQNRSCETPEAIPQPSGSPQAPAPTGQPVHPGTPVSLAPQLRGVEHFKSRLLEQASGGSSQAAQARFNPLAFSLIALLPFGCNSDKSTGGSFQIPDASHASAGTGGRSTGGSGGNAGTSGAAGSGGGGARAGSDAGIHDGGTSHPLPGEAVLWSTSPCGADGTIPDLDDGIGVCANYTDNQHHLFSWDPQGAAGVDDGAPTETSILKLGFAPDQVLQGTGSKYFITHHGDLMAVPPSPTGLAVIDNDIGMQDQVDFATLVLPAPMASSAGSMVSRFGPSFPKGIAQVGDRLFIATSNLVALANPVENYFNPGTILIYNTGSASWEHYLTTTDFNPTSMTVINGKIYVVNTGDVNPARDQEQMATTPSSIDIINPQTLQIEKNIPLGGITTGPIDRENLAAGIHGEIAVSPDGNTLVLPTGDNSGRLIVLDVASETTREITVTTGSKVMLTGLVFHPSQQFLYVGNFNDGKIFTVNLGSGQVVNNQSLDNDTTNFAGISDGLWQSASVFMGVGPEIYRLPITQ